MWLTDLKHLAVGPIVLAAMLGIAACGGAADSPAVVRVDNDAIRASEVTHWTALAAAPAVLPSGPLRAGSAGRHRTSRQLALEFLIASRWLAGEAAARGVRVSGAEVTRRFRERRSELYPGGEVELRAALKTAKWRLADAVFETRTELTATKLRERLARSEPSVTAAQVVAYYARHRRRFTIPERRYFDIVNRTSEAEAQRVKRELEAGRSMKGIALHESLDRPRTAADIQLGQSEIVRAVFSTRPGVLGGPVSLYGDRSVFRITRIVPARPQPLAQVEPAIKASLTAVRRRQTLASFLRAWRAKWIARTSCRPGYVVQRCRQYQGVRVSEGTLSHF